MTSRVLSEVVHKITPRQADEWVCPLRATTPDAGSETPALQRGAAIHTVLKLDGLRQLRGHTLLDPAEMAERATPRGLLQGDTAYLALATAAVAGMRRFLAEHDLELLRVEEFVRTGERPVSEVPGARVFISGRIDAVCRERASGTLVLLDAKTGTQLPSDLELAERPSSFLYTHLGRFWCQQTSALGQATTERCAIVQVLPHQGAWSSACLTPAQEAEGRAFVVEMVRALHHQQFPAVRGDWCAHCPIGLAGHCPIGPVDDEAAW